MTHSERLTPEALAEIAARLEVMGAQAEEEWGVVSDGYQAVDDIAALLAHAAALEAENAALRRVAEAAAALRGHSRLELLPGRVKREYVTPMEWHHALQDALEADALAELWNEAAQEADDA